MKWRRCVTGGKGFVAKGEGMPLLLKGFRFCSRSSWSHARSCGLGTLHMRLLSSSGFISRCDVCARRASSRFTGRPSCTGDKTEWVGIEMRLDIRMSWSTNLQVNECRFDDWTTWSETQNYDGYDYVKEKLKIYCSVLYIPSANSNVMFLIHLAIELFFVLSAWHFENTWSWLAHKPFLYADYTNATPTQHRCENALLTIIFGLYFRW